jgi:hypothetical protein
MNLDKIITLKGKGILQVLASEDRVAAQVLPRRASHSLNLKV